MNRKKLLKNLREKNRMANGGVSSASDAMSLSPILKRAYSDEKEEFEEGGYKGESMFDKLRKKIRKSTGQSEPFERPSESGSVMTQDEKMRKMVEEANEATDKLKKKR